MHTVTIAGTNAVIVTPSSVIASGYHPGWSQTQAQLFLPRPACLKAPGSITGNYELPEETPDKRHCYPDGISSRTCGHYTYNPYGCAESVSEPCRPAGQQKHRRFIPIHSRKCSIFSIRFRNHSTDIPGFAIYKYMPDT